MTFLLGKEMQIAIQFLVNVSIRQAATTIISIDKTEILCGRFEDLQFCTKIYHKSTHCDISLKFYGLSAPEGSLAESVISEAKANALAANFVHSPAGDDVDWRLSATIAPCHVTVLMESIDRFLEFLKRSNAVSPTVALETATALQIRIEKVTRRAQEHLQMVLEEQSRFALDIDLDAPKLVVPMKGSASSASRSYFLLDFGHFTLTTNERHWDDQRQSLYSRFYISGRDFAAFFMDAGPDSGSNTLLPSIFHGQLTLPSPDCDNFCSLIDRCGMSVIVDQIKVPHPSYPSTRVSIQVPNLSVHFSPERYRRISDLIALFYSTMESADHTVNDNPETVTMSWYPAELSSSARILVWRGIGNSIAEWQPCFLVLSGVYLYVLESETSQSYQRCLSMAGRQVFEVSPTNVGGSLFSVAVCFRGLDIQKALESSNTLIIEFQDDEEKALWFKQLTQATYRASAPASVDILEESSDKVSEQRNSQVNKLGKVDLVISGALIETKLFIYGKTGEKKHVTVRERLILEIIAGRGKALGRSVIFWKPNSSINKLFPLLTKIFEDGINESATDPGAASVWATNRTYLVSPINGVLKYHRLGKQESKDPESPFD